MSELGQTRVRLADGLPSAHRAELEGACARLGLALDAWRSGEPVAADLIVGSLPAGARSVPRELLPAAEEATVLLLTNEALVRPSVTLHAGRVVLLSNPWVPARMEGVLRMLANKSTSTNACETRLGPDVWSAHFHPASTTHDACGALAVIPFDGASEDEVCAVRAAGRLAECAAVVRLSLATREWVVYWPRPDRRAWLHSPVRLPHVLDLAATAARSEDSVLRLAAHEGDVLLALGGPCDPELVRSLEGGAAALLDHDLPSGATMEVR